MTDLLRNVRIAAPLVVVQASVYWTLNHFPLFQSRELPLTWLDRNIPFWTWTVWGYFAMILMAVAMPLAVRDGRVFRQLVVAYGVSVGTAVLFFAFWPTHYPRPPAPTDHSLHNLAYYWLIHVDTPECCFPSSHIIVPVIASAALWQDGRRGGFWRLLPFAMAICTLTILTTKQHYFWDLLGGLAAAALGIAVSRRLAPIPPTPAGRLG